MPRDDVPETRAEALQGQTEDRNADDRTEFAQQHGLPGQQHDTLERPASRPEPRKGEQVEATRGPDGRTAKEVAYLARHREHMDNDELERFLAGESQFHHNLKEADGFTPFTDQEETFLIQHRDDDIEELAEELERDPAQVRAKLQLMGLQDH